MHRALLVTMVVGTVLTAGAAQTIRQPDEVPEPVGEDQRVQASDIDAVLADTDVILLDVREPWELERYGTREGYINIPIAELEDRLDELPRDKMILTA